MDLTDVSMETLLGEVRRRLECQMKPEKRVILVGARPPDTTALTTICSTDVVTNAMQHGQRAVSSANCGVTCSAGHVL